MTLSSSSGLSSAAGSSLSLLPGIKKNKVSYNTSMILLNKQIPSNRREILAVAKKKPKQKFSQLLKLR